MLFDLQGKRKRLIQTIYLFLAILMGGGLVLFGIGGEVSGGLLDAFRGGPADSGSLVKERIEKANKQLERNPKNRGALEDLIQAHYQAANDTIKASENPETEREFSEEGKAELRRAGEAWERYIKITPRPRPSLTNLMIQVYGEDGLKQNDRALAVAQQAARRSPNANNYFQVTYYAKLAGQERVAKLAGARTIELAPKEQRAQIRAQISQLLKPPPAPEPKDAPAENPSLIE